MTAVQIIGIMISMTGLTFVGTSDLMTGIGMALFFLGIGVFL